MPWIKLDDHWMDHPKIIRAGRDARDLWLASLTWCARHLTDGLLPVEILPSLAVMAGIDVAKCQQIASVLLGVCLWDATDNGYIVHDYLEYNPSKEQSDRVKMARKEAGRHGGEVKASKTASKTLAKSKQKSAPYPYPIKEEEEDENNVYTKYQHNIGALTPIISDKLTEDMEEYTPAWVVSAIDVAVTNEKRNLGYVEAILKRWKRDGFQSDTKPVKAASGKYRAPRPKPEIVNGEEYVSP